MSKSAHLRLSDARAIFRLAGECRELGDDRLAWRDRWIAGLADLVDADMGCAGEMAGCRSLQIRDLGVTFWGRGDRYCPASLEAHMEAFHSDPHYSPAMVEYHRRNVDDHGICLTRTEFIDDRTWHASPDYQASHRAFRIDHTLWCFRAISGAEPDENEGVVLCRGDGESNFGGRERTIIREALATIAPMVGGSLARFADPSPLDLSPRAREVLLCLLQGDGDKQVAARLSLSPHTVNQYTKRIYRHFAVESRAELLARWIRRGWGHSFPWSR